MKLNFTLSKNNKEEEARTEINTWISQHGIKKETHPGIYMFLTNPESFYTQHCTNLSKYITREKRFLDFETPNRVLITHEYDINFDKEQRCDDYYYLFNPHNRLGWLKIFRGNLRITVASSDIVKRIIFSILDDEISKFENKETIAEEIWNLKIGLPCFIKLSKYCVNSFILSVTYYESIKRDTEQEIYWCDSFWPIHKRCIKYSYIPLERKTNWLYIKAPEHFEVKYSGVELKSNNVIQESTLTEKEEPETERISLTIINKNNPFKDIPEITFEIKVPPSLYQWYATIYLASILTLGAVLFAVFNRFWLIFSKPRFYVPFNPDLFSVDGFGPIVMTVLAAIIATRGWLIHEETILQRYSIRESCILIFTLVLFLIGLLIPTS